MAQERKVINQAEKRVILIKDLPKSDQPRKRLSNLGEQFLSTPEILSIVLKTGTNGENALRLAERLLVVFGGVSGLAHASIAELTNIKGIGLDKASRIHASLELGQRLYTASSVELFEVTAPNDVALFLMSEMPSLEEEQLTAVFLNTRNRILGVHTICAGNLESIEVQARDVFLPAIKANAAAIVLAHNYSPVSLTVSSYDVQLARELIEAGRLFNISVLDHIIIAEQRYVSLRERGIVFDVG